MSNSSWLAAHMQTRPNTARATGPGSSTAPPSAYARTTSRRFRFLLTASA